MKAMLEETSIHTPTQEDLDELLKDTNTRLIFDLEPGWDDKEDGQDGELSAEDLDNVEEITIESLQEPPPVTREEYLERVKKRKEWWVVREAPASIQGDREIMLEAVKQSGIALLFASPPLKNDREIVLETVKNNGGAIQWAHEDMYNDLEIVRTAREKTGMGKWWP